MRFWIWLSLALALSAAPAVAQVRGIGEAPYWQVLDRFSSEDEFQRYLVETRAAARRAMRRTAPGKQEGPEAECPPELAPCEDINNEAIVVTGSRISAPAAVSEVTSITNVQTAGVDEGGIVKLYGRFLIVLQDGRLFSVDTGAAPGALRLVDRVDVYRSADDDTWYDEILISDNRVVVTGYNYGEDATEFSVFSINRAGRLTREAVYFLSSDDYYDSENYATRLVNGNLVIYTSLHALEADAHERMTYPLVRRWLSQNEFETRATRGRPLYHARDIYRPIQPTFDPAIHTISVCPLGSTRAGDELECRSTAITAHGGREFYVSNTHIYLWTFPVEGFWYDAPPPSRCDTPRERRAGADGALFQIPLAGGAPQAQLIRGRPYDQLSMDSDGREFRALSVWFDVRCPDERGREMLPLRYVAAPLADFSNKPGHIAASRYTPLPGVSSYLENRFTSGHLVYAGLGGYSSAEPHPNDDPRSDARIVVVPIGAPSEAVVLQAPHDAVRVESLGRDAIIAGYRDIGGLNLSLLDLSASPRIADTLLLPHRFESENRSHAFNAAIEADGSGMLGLATVTRQLANGRWWGRSRHSDVSFISLRDGRLSDQGALEGQSPVAPGYECEVSCIDWYGNTRALFIAGRIFALSGTELIEGVRGEGGVRDLARLNLTQPLARPSGRARRAAP